MQSHPDALVLVTGDFNYRSTGLSAKFIQRSAGLFQIVDVPTRDNVTLDWCLTNCNNLFKSVQPPPLLESSDHNMIAHDHSINSYSAWKKINGGLPQGTRLGPLLFAVLVNSLLKRLAWKSKIC